MLKGHPKQHLADIYYTHKLKHFVNISAFPMENEKNIRTNGNYNVIMTICDLFPKLYELFRHTKKKIL